METNNQNQQTRQGSTSIAVGETYGNKQPESTEPEGFNINRKQGEPDRVQYE